MLGYIQYNAPTQQQQQEQTPLLVGQQMTPLEQTMRPLPETQWADIPTQPPQLRDPGWSPSPGPSQDAPPETGPPPWGGQEPGAGPPTEPTTTAPDRTILYVALGVGGLIVVGGGAYLLLRKKR